jgi:hypothetical protein
MGNKEPFFKNKTSFGLPRIARHYPSSIKVFDLLF